MAELDRVLRDLDVSFDAALAREEEEVAADLAYSLNQDLDIRGAIRRWGSAHLRLADSTLLRIDEIATDFVGAADGTIIVPIGAVTFVRGNQGAAPRLVDESLVQRLRTWARRGEAVSVRTLGGSTFAGRLSRVGNDHLEIVTRTEEALITFGSLCLVKLDRGD